MNAESKFSDLTEHSFGGSGSMDGQIGSDYGSEFTTLAKTFL
jgi:hypothetical protein